MYRTHIRGALIIDTDHGYYADSHIDANGGVGIEVTPEVWKDKNVWYAGDVVTSESTIKYIGPEKL